VKGEATASEGQPAGSDSRCKIATPPGNLVAYRRGLTFVTFLSLFVSRAYYVFCAAVACWPAYY
jgi:hypothetical protein